MQLLHLHDRVSFWHGTNTLSLPHLVLTVANQYVGQLTTRVMSAVLGNVGSMIIFRVGGDDAVKLKPEMAPVFDVKDMINLGVSEFYIKMTIDGESYDPFSARTLRVLPPVHRSFREEIYEQSRRKYSISADAAKKLIMEEESTIIRSAQEKAIIEGKKGGDSAPAAVVDVEPLI